MIISHGKVQNGGDFLKAMLGGAQEEEPTIEPNYDAEEIREKTGESARRRRHLRDMVRYKVAPALFALAILGTLWSPVVVLVHLISSLVVMAALANILVNFADIFFLRSNENRGRYDLMAHPIFAASSPYWKYRDFEEDKETFYPTISYIAAVSGGLFLLGWYFTLGLVLVSFFTNAMVGDMVNKKGQFLLAYKEKWTQYHSSRIAAETEARRRQDEILREYSEEQPKANALGPDGPEYIPEDLQGKDTIGPEDADRIINMGDDEGDSHIRGG